MKSDEELYNAISAYSYMLLENATSSFESGMGKAQNLEDKYVIKMAYIKFSVDFMLNLIVGMPEKELQSLVNHVMFWLGTEMEKHEKSDDKINECL